MTIKYNNLAASHESFLPLFFKDVQKLFSECDFIGASSKAVANFEKEFAKYIGTEYALGVASGTDALLLAFDAIGISSGDEVIMPAFGFIATADVVVRLGGKPVFVDIDPETCNIDVKQIEGRITARTKAIAPVHLFGQSCDMQPILDIAEKHSTPNHKIWIVEDVAQSCGTYASLKNGKKCGAVGDFGCFSFYPTKNLGAAGDAGAITCNSPEMAEKIRKYRDHGRNTIGDYEIVGYNSRLDTIQAYYLSRKLEELDENLLDRIANARLYGELLSGLDNIRTPEVPDEEDNMPTNTFNYYTIRVSRRDNRDRLRNWLKEKNIETCIYYPISMHMTSALKPFGYDKGDFKEAEKAATEVLSLPVWPGLLRNDIQAVCKAIKEFINNSSSTKY